MRCWCLWGRQGRDLMPLQLRQHGQVTVGIRTSGQNVFVIFLFHKQSKSLCTLKTTATPEWGQENKKMAVEVWWTVSAVSCLHIWKWFESSGVYRSCCFAPSWVVFFCKFAESFKQFCLKEKRSCLCVCYLSPYIYIHISAFITCVVERRETSE